MSDFQQLQDLLDQSFQVMPPQHYLQDFPVWNPQLAPTQTLQLGIFQNEVLVSTASGRIAKIDLNGKETVQVVLVGGVATKRDWEGNGLASHAVSQVISWADDNFAQLALLWGSEHSLYQRLGFDLFGEQLRLPLAAFCSKKRPQELSERGWNPMIFDLIRKRKSGLRLETEDLRWYEKHSHVDWFYQVSNGTVIAYAGVGRGIDLTNQVHEWGGNPIQLQSLFDEVLHFYPKSEILGGRALMTAYGLPVGQATSESMCLAKKLGSGKILTEFNISKIWIWGLDAV